MFDEIELSLNEWIFVANGLIIGSYLHLYKKRSGEKVWQSADDEVDDRLAAYSLSETLRERDILGPLASNRPMFWDSDRWPRWIESIARSEERSASIRLSDIPYTEGRFARIVSEAPEVRLDVPVAQLPPSRVLRHLSFLAKMFILDHTAWVPPQERWGNEVPEDPFIQPSYRSKIAKSLGPKSRSEIGRQTQARLELEALAAEFPGKKMAKNEVIRVLESFNCSNSSAKNIWQNAKLPKEWRSSGRIADGNEISSDEFAKRLRQKGITTLSQK